MLRATQMRDGFDQSIQGALQQADTIYAILLIADASQQIAIPLGANLVEFSVSGASDFYAKFVNAAIAVPGANLVDGTAPELKPRRRACSGKGYISLVAPANCIITMAFYQ